MNASASRKITVVIQRTLNSVFSRWENESKEVSHRVEAAFVCHWLSDDDIEARGVERVGGGNVADRGFVGGGGAVEAFEDPFEDTAVFTVARPHEVALFVSAEPVSGDSVLKECQFFADHAQ